MIINFDNLKSTLTSYKAIGIALLWMILIFWTLSFINWKIEDAKKIALLDVEKTKRIVDIEKEIKPLEKEINTLQTKLSPLLECRATIKNSLGQLDNPSCEKGGNDNKETLIPKAKAEEIYDKITYKSANSWEVLIYPFPYWRVNSNWFAQEHIKLKGNDIKERTADLLKIHWLTPEIWFEVADKYNIKYWVMECIAKADSSLWKQLKTKYNYWNVGNNDRWNKVDFNSEREWVEAIWRVLNNRYLWNIYTIGYLSWWGRKVIWAKPCTNSNEYCYATSLNNWNVNILNCLSNIYVLNVDESFEFRTK